MRKLPLGYPAETFAWSSVEFNSPLVRVSVKLMTLSSGKFAPLAWTMMFSRSAKARMMILITHDVSPGDDCFQIPLD